MLYFIGLFVAIDYMSNFFEKNKTTIIIQSNIAMNYNMLAVCK